MAKIPSKKLYDLIKSLNRGEKRVFKQLAMLNSRERSPKYLMLFDLLDSMDEFDEQILAKKLGILSKNKRSLSQMKGDLYEKVLQSLRYYYDNSKNQFINSQINQHLDTVEVLYRRSLFTQAYDAFLELKKLVNTYDKQLYKPLVLNWEKHLTLRMGVALNEKFAQIYAEEAQAFSELEFTAKLINLNHQVISINRTKGTDWQLHVIPAAEKLEYKFTTEKLRTSTKLLYYNTFALYHRVISGNLQKGQDYNIALINFLEQSPDLLKTHLTHFYVTVNNTVNSALLMKQFKEAAHYWLKLKDLSNYSIKRSSNLSHIRLHFQTGLAYYNSVGLYNEAIELIDDLSPFLEYIKDKGHKVSFYSMFAYAYFIAQNYNKALDWVDLLLNEKDMQYRGDILTFVRLINLVIHYELGNTFLIDDLARSTWRFIKKQNPTSATFEKTIIKGIKDLVKNQNNKQAFADLLNNIEQQIQVVYNNAPKEVQAFEWRLWIKSKQQNISLANLLQQRLVISG